MFTQAEKILKKHLVGLTEPYMLYTLSEYFGILTLSPHVFITKHCKQDLENQVQSNQLLGDLISVQ